MKLRDLKDKIDHICSAKEVDLDNDIMLVCGAKNYHAAYAKTTNYQKRDELFTSRVFIIVGE